MKDRYLFKAKRTDNEEWRKENWWNNDFENGENTMKIDNSRNDDFRIGGKYYGTEKPDIY